VSTKLPPITFAGLASGLDTDNIIKQLMELEGKPLVRLQNQRLDLQKDSGAWKDVETRMNSLLGALSVFDSKETFFVKDVTSSDEAILTASAESLASPGSYRISVSQLAQAHKVYSNGTTSSVNIGVGSSATFSISVDTTPSDGVSNPVSKTVVVQADASGNVTLEMIRDAINKDAGTLVSATIVQSNTAKYLILTSRFSGAAGSIGLTDDPTHLVLHAIGLFNPDETLHTLANAQDAKFTIEGLPDVFTSSGNTVRGVIDGVTLNLTGIGAATVTVADSPDKTIDKVGKFIDEYNSLMDFIATKLGKAVTGTPGDLYGDPTLIRIQSQLRKAVTALASLGIGNGTGSSYDIAGKIQIQDKAKLSEAIANNPDATWETLNTVAAQLRALLGDKNGGFIQTAGEKQNMLADQVKDLDEQIRRWEDRLAVKEMQLRRQFTALESALAEVQAQGAWLSSQILSLGGLSTRY